MHTYNMNIWNFQIVNTRTLCHDWKFHYVVWIWNFSYDGWNFRIGSVIRKFRRTIRKSYSQTVTTLSQTPTVLQRHTESYRYWFTQRHSTYQAYDSVCAVHLQSMYSPYAEFAECIYSRCKMHIQNMYTCSLRVQCMTSAFTLYICCMYSRCKVHENWMYSA